MLTQGYLQYPKWDLGQPYSSNQLNFWKPLLRHCLKFLGASGFNKGAFEPTDQLLLCKKAPKLGQYQATLHTSAYFISWCKHMSCWNSEMKSAYFHEGFNPVGVIIPVRKETWISVPAWTAAIYFALGIIKCINIPWSIDWDLDLYFKRKALTLVKPFNHSWCFSGYECMPSRRMTLQLSEKKRDYFT